MPPLKGHKYSFNVSGQMCQRIERRVHIQQRAGKEYTRQDFFIEAVAQKLTAFQTVETPPEHRLILMLDKECRKLEAQISKLEAQLDEHMDTERNSTAQ